ncbi:peptide ABC transporter substrate-binding protein [Malaciobacter molluscorum LMG 25693]|uniref:Extracellular solute-binding protein n=1 Tax=Malaciobacter molluscorum LMG 25693 TaxID=870501 RepID=A0A2G1DF47_9BACT|nr:peptide-binding protein [Malaciobacter molluscorum]AXX91220.1 extracellular solute-binding protein [Malaciobacter molluscorum LMG 25693]PHO17103.1 peptide ABC transporter substrate-binding protein [Malaciobacter molluscorum LMG 25693]
MKKTILLFFLITNLLVASTLNLSISSSPSKLNPILSNDTASTEISQWLFNGLLKYDKDGNIIPDIAKSFKFTNKTTLIIKLKKHVLWHDKKEVTSKDIIFTYNTIINPKIYVSFRSNYNKVKSVKALDKYTVEIKYTEPYFKALEIWLVGLLPYHILKNEKNLMTSKFNKHPIGTGPYILKDLKNSSDIILKANDNYFEGRPKIDKIKYKFYPDTTTSFLMLKQNKLDISTLTALQLDRQIDKDFLNNYKIIESQSFSYDYVGLNLKNKKFKDIKVRKALSLAINRQQLVDILFFGHGKVCNGPFLPGSFVYNNKIKSPKQNIKEAKKLLKEAGYDKNNPLEFELTTNTGNEIRINAAQIIQHQLKKAGVNVKIRVLEWQAFLNTVVLPKKFEALLLGWSTTLAPDAYPLWHSKSQRTGGFNLVHYNNKKIDNLIEEGAKTINRKKFAQIYKEIFAQIVNDLPYLFLYIPNSITVVNKDIKYIKPSFLGIMHNQIEWEK